MSGSDMDMAVLCARRGQQSSPQDPADDLGHRAENLGYSIRQAVITQNIPLREAAHNRGVEGINHPADPGLAYAIGAHRAWLDIAVKRVAAKPLPTDRPLRLRKGDDLRVTAHVAASHAAV